MDRKGAGGAVLLELALIVPVLILVLFGLVEVGRGLYQQHILTKAVESGTRYMGREPELVVIDEDAETCDPNEPTWTATAQKAKNLVVYGDPYGGTEPLLANLSVTGVNASVRWGENADTGELTGRPCVIRMEAASAFDPVIAPDDFLGLGTLTLRASAEERYIGE